MTVTSLIVARWIAVHGQRFRVPTAHELMAFVFKEFNHVLTEASAIRIRTVLRAVSREEA